MSAADAEQVENELASWLKSVFDSSESRQDSATNHDLFRLPSSAAADLLAQRIASFDEADATLILRNLLIPTGSFGADRRHAEWLRGGGWRAHMTEEEIENSPIPLSTRTFEYGRRLLAYENEPRRNPPPWEGITWVLDLLPEFGQQAIDSVGSYLLANAQFLPDGRYIGLTDALLLLRARYVGLPGDDVEDRRLSLLKLPPRSFERLVQQYVRKQNYETVLTAPGRDGGVMSSPIVHRRRQCNTYSSSARTGPVGSEGRGCSSCSVLSRATRRRAG